MPKSSRWWVLGLLCLLSSMAGAARTAHGADEAPSGSVEANRTFELSLTSDKSYDDPFNQVQLDCVFTDPDGQQFRVPGFWAGGKEWRVRYASGRQGRHKYRTECSDRDNAKLHGASGTCEVTPYQGSNPLFRHGPLRVSINKRYFEHADGTPFLWLGDTWWMALCQRLKWPDDFKALAADRREKGFNVIQIIAGLYPDMPAFDPRGANEAGFPWTEDYRTIRPEYFNAADRRITYLVEQGFTPCIVGAWGYHLPWMGVDRAKQHWRYLVARYGSLPVVWCVAGEGIMPYYLSKTREKDMEVQKRGWTEVAEYLRKIDPFDRLVSVHPSDTARNMVTDVSVLDYDMLQTGHGDRDSIPSTIDLVRRSVAAKPIKPTVNSEVCYEGILGTCPAEVQRFMIWSCLLSGEAGHTYGANGIWQVNRRDQPYGKSPHGGNWGNTPWDDAMKLPGSRQTALAHQLLLRFPWWHFQPHTDWASFGPEHKPPKQKHLIPYMVPYAAGIAGQVRVIYAPTPEPVVVKKLESDTSYEAIEFNPVDGKEKSLGVIKGSQPDNTWTSPKPTTGTDWVLVLKRKRPAGEEANDASEGKSARGSSPADTDRGAFALHPQNPKYFQFRGKPLVLIAATEHYGSVVNRPFDFDRYLQNAAENKQTMTRTFLLFREQQSSRNPSSPIKPESPDYIAPYPRTGPGNAMDGEPKYDIDQWNDEFFVRLRRFLERSSELGIVVELTLFSNTYGDAVWNLHPLNASNNIQGIGKVPWPTYMSLRDQALVDRQIAYVKKVLAETASCDNIYYEICNEPGGGANEKNPSPADVDAWQEKIGSVIRQELARLGRKRLIFGSQAFGYTPAFHQKLDETFTGSMVDAVNVHPLPDTLLGGRAYQMGNFMSKELTLQALADFCRATQRYEKPCVLDEDNTASLYRDEVGWTIHRKRAWIAVMSQAHYDYIDFSITVGSEAGTPESRRGIRAWMRNLSDFIHKFDFIAAQPAHDWLQKKPAHTVSAVMAVPAREYIAYLADAREVTDRTAGQPIAGAVSFKLPAGKYRASVYSPTTGVESPAVLIEATDGTQTTFELPAFTHDTVLRVKRDGA